MSSIDSHTDVEEAVETSPELTTIQRNTMIPDATSVRKPLLPASDLRIISAASNLDTQLGFLAHGVMVDNLTGQWLCIPAMSKYIPPNTIGATIRIAEGMQRALLIWEAPAGTTQGNGPTGSFAVVRFTEQPVEASAGLSSTAQSDGSGNEKVALYLSGSASQNGWLGAQRDTAPGNGAYLFYVFNMVYNGATWDRLRTATIFKSVQNINVVAGTPATVWTPAAGKKFRLLGWDLAVTTATNAILFKDNGTEIARTVGGGPNHATTPVGWGNGILSAAANNVLQIDVLTSTMINGTVFGTEE